MADLPVDRLEVVDVEYDQRELPAIATRARDLSLERLVEVAAVVQAGQRVEIRKPSCLAKAESVLDRGRGAARDLRQRGREIVDGRVARGRVDRQPADALAAVGERHRERLAHPPYLDVRPVGDDDR